MCEQGKVLIGGLSLETTEDCSQKCNMDSEQVKVLIGGLSLETTEECSQKCNMDSEQGKVLIGGLSLETTEERLKDYFKTFGDVTEAMIMKDRLTGRPQDFGFLVFADPAVADSLLLDSKHNIDGRMVSCFSSVLFLTRFRSYKL